MLSIIMLDSWEQIPASSLNSLLDRPANNNMVALLP